jgi:hypothetical protein
MINPSLSHPLAQAGFVVAIFGYFVLLQVLDGVVPFP